MQTITYLFCQIVKDNSHIDTVWSLTFIVPNLIMIYILYATGTKIDVRTIVTNACLCVWGLRLAVHIGCRHSGEDYRYVSIRKRLMAAGTCGYYILAYLLIFVFQGAMALIVNAPVLYTTIHSSKLSAA